MAAKTQPTNVDPQAYIDRIDAPERRADAGELLQLMREVTGAEPVIWGESMVGFGSYEYHYQSGRSGTWSKVGFAARKQQLVLYLNDGCLSYTNDEHANALLDRLGRHSRGKACLYVKRLADVDRGVLRELIAHSWQRAAIGEQPASLQ